MWVVIVLSGGYAVLAAVVAVWSARVCFHLDTKPAVRAVAYKIFRAACRRVRQARSVGA